MKNFMERASELIENTDSNIIDRISSVKKHTREQAIVQLTTSLDISTQEDTQVFVSIPLEFINRGDAVSAIWYVITLAKSGNPLPWEIVKIVCSKSIDALEEFLVMGDSVMAMDIWASLDSFFRMAKQAESYKDISELQLCIGRYEEQKGNTGKALGYFDEAIAGGIPEGYLASSKLYEKSGDVAMSETLLVSGWESFNDPRLLEELIGILCRQWKQDAAAIRYRELSFFLNGKVRPFLFYKGTVEDDQELATLEGMIAMYFMGGSFEHSDNLKKLADSASEYIHLAIDGLEIEGEILRADMLLNDGKMDFEKYEKLMKRKIWLMQVDILTLGNIDYAVAYLSIIREFGFSPDDRLKDILDDHFSDHFSPEVSRFSAIPDPKGYRNGETENSEDSEINEMEWEIISNDASLTGVLTEDIYAHVSRMGELFFQQELHELHKNVIAPLIFDCAAAMGEDMHEVASRLGMSLTDLKKMHDYYQSFQSDTRKAYETFIEKFDKKHWAFYRRQIQFLAMDSENVSEDSHANTAGNESEFPMDDTKRYPEILMKNIGVACVFWMQKFLNTDMFRYDDDTISEIIARYRLEYVDTPTALLFASLLGNVSAACAFSYIAEYPDMLRLPAANYIVTSILCEMTDDAEREKVLDDLHEMIRERYPKGKTGMDMGISNPEAPHDFFAHLEDMSDDILSVGPASRENHVNIALTQANALRLQNKDLVHSIAEFETAAGIGSLEWLIQAWNLYESSGYFEKALECFEKALDMQYSIDTLTKILYCSLVFGRYEVTRKYLDMADRKGNNVNEYWAAFYLWQGQNRAAFEKLISMLSEGEGIRDTPAGTIYLLSKAAWFELHAKDSFDWQNDEMRVLATFLSIFLLDWKISNIFAMALRHWEYILSILNRCTTDEMLAEKIIEIVSPLIRKSDRKPEADTIEAEAVSVLHQYAYATQVYLAGLTKDEKDASILRDMEKCTRDLKYHIVLVLNKLPGGKNYANGWMGDIGSVELENRFVHRASVTIQ